MDAPLWGVLQLLWPFLLIGLRSLCWLYGRSRRSQCPLALTPGEGETERDSLRPFSQQWPM